MGITLLQSIITIIQNTKKFLKMFKMVSQSNVIGLLLEELKGVSYSRTKASLTQGTKNVS